MKTIFCLVSRQAMANVLPVLMYKPENVFLLATPEEKSCADNLEKLFRSKSINVQRKDGLDAYDYIHFKNFVKQQLEKQQDDIWLNVTGGTKLMALAAYEAFAEKKKKIIYCNTERKQIIHVYPEVYPEPLKLNLNIKDYLKAYGYVITQTKTNTVNKEYFKLFEKLKSESLLGKFSNFLDYYRKCAKDGSRMQTIPDKNKIFKVQKTSTSTLLFVKDYKIALDGDTFLRGSWLEYFMFYSLKEQNINPELGVRIVSESNVENEIDLIFLKNYQLHLISCKSGKQNAPNKDIYEIETLRNVAGGTFGKAFLLTTTLLKPRIQQRARDLNIQTLTLNDLILKNIFGE